jgi:hypothetical protein
MTDARLREWWPDLGTLVAALREAGHTDVADRLVDAVRAGATSSEIVGGVGLVLREERGLRSGLGEAARRAWDAVMADVRRAFPGSWLGHWLDRLGLRRL